MKTKKQSAVNIAISTFAVTAMLTPQLTGATDTGREIALKQKEQAAQANPITKDIWQACKGVKYVPEFNDANQKTVGKNDNCPDCDTNGKVQMLPEVGIGDLYVKGKDLALAQDFLGQCTTRVIAINKNNKSDLDARAACFDGTSKDSKCSAIRKETYDQIAKYSPILRQDLALSHSAIVRMLRCPAR
jgi:hypothetical protein